MALIRYIAVFLLIYFIYKILMSLIRGIRNRSSFAEPEMTADKEKERQKLIPEDEGDSRVFSGSRMMFDLMASYRPRSI